MSTEIRSTDTTIKMVARNPLTRRIEEVHPEDEVAVSDMIALFRGQDGRFYSIPGFTAAMVYGEWLDEQRRSQ